MSVPNISVQGNKNLLNKVPDELIGSVFEFLKKEEILATAEVCRSWHCNTAMIEQRQEVILGKEYSQDLVKAFHNNNLSIFKLPQLELSNYKKQAYITFLRPQNMQGFPVMRFKDWYGRPGLAFHIRGQDTEGVLAIFRRYTEINGHWTFGENSNIESIYRAAHLATAAAHADQITPVSCPDCPFPGGYLVNFKIVQNLLSGQDPLFQLVNREKLSSL